MVVRLRAVRLRRRQGKTCDAGVVLRRGIHLCAPSVILQGLPFSRPPSMHFRTGETTGLQPTFFSPAGPLRGV